MAQATNNESAPFPDDTIRVAHLGNSIQYYNDMPRLLEHMLKTRFQIVDQDSCLRGGATLPSLFEKGNGMRNKFYSRPEVSTKKDGSPDIGAPTVADLLSSKAWDVVVLNDHTQSPARSEKREQTIHALRAGYIPLFNQLTTDKTIIVFIQTAAYRKAVKDSEDLGTFDEFTEKIHWGYQQYAALLNEETNGNIQAKVAPVGRAYQYIKEKYGDMEWGKLYALDDFHPSPHGTLLEASVLYCIIVGERPPKYDAAWWETARYMQPPDHDPLPLPNIEDAELLQDAAWDVCQE